MWNVDKSHLASPRPRQYGAYKTMYIIALQVCIYEFSEIGIFSGRAWKVNSCQPSCIRKEDEFDGEEIFFNRAKWRWKVVS